MRSLQGFTVYTEIIFLIILKMKAKSKLLTIKIQPDLLATFTDFANSRNMKRGTMIKSVVSEFIAKQKQQAA